MIKVQTKLGKRANTPVSVVLDGNDNGSWHQSMVRCKECSKDRGHTVFMNSNKKILYCPYCMTEKEIK